MQKVNNLECIRDYAFIEGLPNELGISEANRIHGGLPFPRF